MKANSEKTFKRCQAYRFNITLDNSININCMY